MLKKDDPMQRRTLLKTGAVGLCASVASPFLHAQTLPAGNVRIVVGFPPGGGTDALARVMAVKLQTMWNVSVVIENKAGAAGVIAADHVAKQNNDGTTLLMAHINSHAIAPSLQPKLGYVVERDFTPLVLVGVTPNLLICNTQQPAKTVKELVDLCKQNPGKISFASAGGGSAQHLALEMFKLRAGIQALHVPYKGSGPALTDLIGGQVQYSFETMTSATPHVKAGKVVALAQTRGKRAKGHPGVPTMEEQGFAGFDATTWYGLVGPARMNPAMVKRMNEDMNRVMAMPDVQEKFEQYGAEDGGGTPEKFSQFIATEQEKWARVVKDAKVQADS
jgi:tripartite-type tricarboxylate transporter receptor subunit TctC